MSSQNPFYMQTQTSVVSRSREDRIREQYETGQYALTPAGLLKLLAIISLITQAVLSLSSTVCPNALIWYGFVSPIIASLSVIVLTIDIALFSCGLNIQQIKRWTVADISVTTILSIIILITSIVSISYCKPKQTIHEVPAPLGIAISLVLAMSAALLYIGWKSEPDEDPQLESNFSTLNRNISRSSINA